jgi:hypothetical protein
MLRVIITFAIIYFLINFIKPGQNIELMITLAIVYFLYHYNYLNTIIGTKVDTETNLIIPDPANPTQWLNDWKTNLLWIDEFNPENYIDIIRGLDYYMELYQDVMNTDYKSNQKYDSLQMLKKEILKTLESTSLSIPITKQNQLDKTYKLMENQLGVKDAEVGSVINQQWDAGKVSYITSPIFMGGAEPVNSFS